MKNLFYLLIASMLVIGVAQDNSKDSMAAMQAKMAAKGSAWKASRCGSDQRDGVNYKISINGMKC